MYTYQIVEKQDGYKFLIRRGRKKILKKSEYFPTYENAAIAAMAELQKWNSRYGVCFIYK